MPRPGHFSDPGVDGSMHRRGGLLLRWLNLLGPMLVLVAIYGAFTYLRPQMLSHESVEDVIIQTVIVGTAAVGMTLVIIAGGIDLSVGSIIAFSSVTSAWLLAELRLPAAVAMAGGVLAGAAWGLVNGLIVTRAKVVPFIVTLGTLLIVRGLAKGLSGSAPIDINYGTWITEAMKSLGEHQRWMLLPPGGWTMILLAVAFWAMLRFTRLGRHAQAIGSNEQTARLCGVPVDRVKLWVYSLSGACAGLSGFMLLSRQAQGDPTAAAGYELDVIAAVVIGGGSLSGGQGSLLGTVVGALIMSTIRKGCSLQGLQPWVTQVVTGAIIVLAVALDRLRHRNR